MPTYNYECQDCGHGFEEFQSMSAKVLRKCPSCGKPRLQRLIGKGAGIIFKGGGFYETDYRKESYQRDKKAAKDGEKPSSGKTEKSPAEPKPAKAPPKSGSDKKKPKPAD
ncbi:MAG: FmdB family zinc ribbon protein [Planctomycetota bacterium]|jgi:putative FmdB family regulatory protein